MLPSDNRAVRQREREHLRLFLGRGARDGHGRDIHFYYSTDEVLYGALPEFKAACERANVPYTVTARPGMTHCYCMLPYFKEAKEDFAMIVEQLKK